MIEYAKMTSDVKHWFGQYPWIILIVLVGMITMTVILRKIDANERKVDQNERRLDFFETQSRTLATAEELTRQTALRDSLFAFGDSLRLQNQQFLLANQKRLELKIDSIFKVVREW